MKRIRTTLTNYAERFFEAMAYADLAGSGYYPPEGLPTAVDRSATTQKDTESGPRQPIAA